MPALCGTHIYVKIRTLWGEHRKGQHVESPVHMTTKLHNQCDSPSLLQQLQLEPLEERRRVNQLAFLYKILNEQVAQLLYVIKY